MTSDPNRVHWEALARDEPADWAGLATEPDGIEEEWVDDPAGLWHDPLAAPAHAEVHGLPATYIQVGAEESLRDDSRQLAKRLREAGVDVRLDEFAGQLHSFQMAAGRTSVASEAIARGGAWLRARLTS